MDTVQDFEDIKCFLDIPETEQHSQVKVSYSKAFQGDDHSVVLNKTWRERDRYRHLPGNGTLSRTAIAFIEPDTSIPSTCRANSPNRNHYLGVTAANRLFPGQGNFKREMTDHSRFGLINAGKIVPQPIENLAERRRNGLKGANGRNFANIARPPFWNQGFRFRVRSVVFRPLNHHICKRLFVSSASDWISKNRVGLLDLPEGLATAGIVIRVKFLGQSAIG